MVKILVAATSPSLEASGHPRNNLLVRSNFLFLPFLVFSIFLIVQSTRGNEMEGYSDGLSYGEDVDDLPSFDSREAYDIARLDKRARYGNFRGDLGKRQSGISLRDIGMDSEFFKNLRLKDVLARKGRVSRKFRGDLGKRSYAPQLHKEAVKDNY